MVGVHGVIFPQGEFTTLQDRTVSHFEHESAGHFVDLLGTGTAAWHSSTMQVRLDDFGTQGICDMWFAAIAATQAVPLLSAQRKRKWLKTHTRYEQRLHSEALNNPEQYFQLYRDVVRPVLAKSQTRRRIERHLSTCHDGDTLTAAEIDLLEVAPSTAQSLAYGHRRYWSVEPVPPPGASIGVGHESEIVKFHLVVTGWNCQNYVAKCLRSIAQQRFGPYRFDVILVDDASDDGTFAEFSRSAILPQADVLQISANMGPAHARHVAIGRIADPDAVVVLLDMDDELEPQALRTVARRYLDNPDCLMTIGNWHDQNGKINPQRFYTAEEIDQQRIREVELFNAPPLRTFKRFLYDQVAVDDLLDQEGKWLETCTDVAIMYPIIDQCRSHNVEVIREPIYLYNRRHAKGTLARFGQPHKIERLEFLKSKPPKPRYQERTLQEVPAETRRAQELLSS